MSRNGDLATLGLHVPNGAVLLAAPHPAGIVANLVFMCRELRPEVGATKLEPKWL